jgi:hypothetical protein
MYKNIATQSIRKPLHKTMDISVDVLRLDQTPSCHFGK